MPTKAISVGKLMLDTQNPRYGKVSSQRDAIRAIINHQGTKLVNIAEHIGRHGMSPMDSLLVLPKGKSFVVLEGNRRLAAIRLLNNPAHAEGTPFESAFKDLAKAYKAPSEVDCAELSPR